MKMNPPNSAWSAWKHVLALTCIAFAGIGSTQPLGAAIAFDNSGSVSGTNAASLSWSHTVGTAADTVLVVGLATEDTSTASLAVSKVTFNGVALTPVPNSIATAGSTTLDQSQLYYLLNPAPGTHSVAVTFKGAVNGVSAGSVSLSGVQQSAPAAAINALDAGTSLSTSISVPAAGAWLVDTLASGAANATLTPSDAAMVKRWSKGQSNSAGAGATKALSTAGAGSMSWNVSTSSQLAQSVAVFLPSGTAATAPVIISQPSAVTVAAGGNATFSVVASGSAPLAYQWLFNGANLAGATASTLSLSNVQVSNAGNYSVKVSNSVGSVTSTTAALTVSSVTTPPTISTQPVSQTVSVGSTATFSVVAAGTAPLSYQWKFNGANLSGATGPALSIANAQAANAGSYTVTVSNSAGSVLSNAATLTVNSVVTAPAITTQPVSQAVNAGSNVTFSVVASGSAPLAYQWKLNGVNLSGATSSALALTNVQSANAGSYTVSVSNSAGSVVSNAATLVVNAVATAPAITSQPASQTVAAGGSATFTVAATGTGPLAFQWKFNGSALTGATSTSLTLSNVQSANAGTYTVTVSNAVGSVTSTGATLTVSTGGGSPSKYNLTGFATVSPGTTGGGVIAETDPAYAKVSTPLQFANAILASNKTGSIKVIEIMNDLNIGWNEVGAAVQATGVFRSHNPALLHPVLLSTGVSIVDIKAKGGGLTIFSANGSTIRHGMLNVKGTSNIIIRNLKFDEMWEWDEATKGQYDKNDWDFIDLGNGAVVNNIWIDHCTFGKSYDGEVDTKGGSFNITFSWNKYVGDDGDTNPNSWVRKQINALEANRSSNPMYNFLRTNGFSVEDIVMIEHGHDKTHLIGSTAFATENANFKVTFHHQYWLNPWDRLPRLRAGNVHNYNIYVDDTQVLAARRLRDARAAAMSSAAQLTLNKTYSFNPPINGSISTENGAVLVEKSVYVDCLWPLRNNQTDPTNPAYTGKIKALDSIYVFHNPDGTTTTVRGNSTDAGNPMGPFQAPVIPFSWNLSGNALPYTYTMDDPASLLPIVQAGAGAGTLTWDKSNWLKTSY